jgi:hypothetical protein
LGPIQRGVGREHAAVDQQITGLEFENENLKEQIAAMKAGNSEAGSGDVMSEEEQANQQAEQFATA